MSLLEQIQGVDVLGLVLRPIVEDGQLVGARVSYDQGAVSISGQLVAVGDELAGTVSVRVEQIAATGIMGISFSGGFSLYVFGYVGAPLGGVPAFFVTGAAGGFGVNRRMPALDVATMASNPFIRVMEGTGPRPGEIEAFATTSEFARLDGAAWFAAGVTFTSFVLIDGTALLCIRLGPNAGVDMVGHLFIDRIPLFYYGGAFKLSVDTQKASFEAKGECELLSGLVAGTAGLAYATFFDTGESVFTLGGYGPRYAAPDRFPRPAPLRLGGGGGVPGLAFEMEVCAYLAITTRALMLGASLSARGELGPFHGWFEAAADALLTWDPFYIDCSASFEAGVGIEVCDEEIEVSCSATVHCWGPEFGGLVTIGGLGVSVDVSFGADHAPPVTKLTPEQFETKFLGAS